MFKKNKEKNSKSDPVVKIKSTQIFSPVFDVKDGIICTKDGRFVKLMEFSPINFSLRSQKERKAIISSFAQAVKLMPRNTQWKVVSRRADVSMFLDRLKKELQSEEDPQCQELILEQMRLISSVGAREGVSRRFYIAFDYEQPPGLSKRPSFDEIRAELETTAMRISSVLAPCGNELLSEDGNDLYTLATLYSIMCRKQAETKTFDERISEEIPRYFAAHDLDMDSDDVFIPVNEFIAPKRIDSATSAQYIEVDGLYYAFAFLPSNTYPNRVAGGWMSILIDIGVGVDVDLFMRKQDIAAVQQKLQYSIRYNRIKARETEESAAGYEELHGAIDSGFYLRRGISSGEDFIQMAILLTICADSPKELKDKCNAVKNYLSTQNLKAKFCNFQNEAAFKSTIPVCQMDNNLFRKSKRNILTSDLASAYPFVSFEVSDPGGIMYGVNKINNSLVFIDNFDSRQYKNANMVILGTSGAGKTYTLQCLALRMRQQKTQVFIIAPDKGHEFQRACDAIGGQYVKISPGSGQNINIMEIRKRDDSVSELLDGVSKESILMKKIQQIHRFMALLIPDITYEEKQVLDEALVTTYHRFGITNRNRSLVDPNDLSKYKTMPVLGDLHNTLYEMGEPARRIHKILTRFVTGSAKSFNAQTNVDLNNKYVVLDISSLSKEMLPLGMMIVLDYVYDKARENRTTKKAIFIDEAWVLLGAYTFIMEIFKVIRGYGGAAIAATQDMQDFFNQDGGKFGKAVINNAKTKIIMQMEADEAEFVAETLNLTEREVQQITKFNRGEGLIVSNSNHVLVSIKASQAENDLITTDRAQLQQIAENKIRQKAAGFKTKN